MSIVHVEKAKYNLRGPVVRLAVTLEIVLGRLQIYLVDLVESFRIVFVLDGALYHRARSLSTPVGVLPPSQHAVLGLQEFRQMVVRQCRDEIIIPHSATQRSYKLCWKHTPS